MTGTRPRPPAAGSRRRVLLAGSLAAALAAAVVLVVVLGGDGERSFEAAPPGCIESWNADRSALAFGRHQSGSHGYYEVQVATLTADGGSGADPGSAGASCAVIFAASALDPEPVSAAQIEKGGVWVPLSQLAGFDRLAALQAEAQTAYNARVTPEGTIEPLSTT